MPPTRSPLAVFPGTTGRTLVHLTDDPAALERGGRWAVSIDFGGTARFARFAHWSDDGPLGGEAGTWRGPDRSAWTTSLDRDQYRERVTRIREAIAAGTVYQVNLCRVLSAPLPDPDRADPVALGALLARGNPAPHAAVLRLPGWSLVSASPERFLHRRGPRLLTSPMKGTAVDAAGLTAKDRAENIMITDLMRNDLARVCRPGSVSVPRLLAVEPHPGLVQLVSDVAGEVPAGTSWAQILAALLPPGSVSGAPKSSALRLIAELEPVDRGPYCGIVGWVDADTDRAELAVAIRTFWIQHDRLHFGTGAGITWHSEPAREWDETQLKARRLIALASGDPIGSQGGGE